MESFLAEIGTMSLKLLPVMLLIGAAPVGDLTIDVGNVRNGNGRVHIDICPQDHFLADDCPYSGEAPATPGVTTVVIRGLPAGRYAAQAFHDENVNGKVDRALFGIPKEGVGFSRNARITFSAPKWRDAEFDFAGHDQRIGFRLRYFLGASGPPKG